MSQDNISGKGIFGSSSSQITDLNVNNNLSVGNTITANTVTATTGNFTNLTGTLSPGQVLIKRNETTRDNATLITGNTSATLANNSNGIHIGYDNTNQIGSIYCINNTNTITDLYLNNTSTLGLGTVHAGGLKTDNLSEETAANGIQVNSGIKLFDYGIYQGSSNIRLNSNSSYVDLQSGGNSILKADTSLITASQALTMTLGGTVPAGQQLTLGAGGSLLSSVKLKLLGTSTSGIYVSTTDNGLNWIAGSFGIEGTVVGRVVLGNLNGVATLGAHNYTGGAVIGWTELNMQDNTTAYTHFGPSAYTSSNKISCSGYIDVQSGYKINNSAILGYSGGATANTFLLPNKASSSYTLATTVDIPTITYRQTNYLTSNGTLVNGWFFGPMGMVSTEANLTYYFNRSGNISNLWVSCTGSPGAGVTYTFTVRKNNADTALSCTVVGTNTTGSNTGTSVAFSAGDVWSVSFATTGGAPVSYAAVSFDQTTS